MDPLTSGYALALGAIVLLWIGVSVFVLSTRAIYDVRRRLVATARRAIEQRFERTANETDDLDWMLRRLPRRTLERIATDPQTPPRVAEAFACHAAEARVGELIELAARHDGELGKWRRIEALRLFARARWYVARPLLAAALDDEDQDVVGAAVTTLGTIDEEWAATLLVGALRDGRTPRSRVATQLEAFPSDISNVLVPLLQEWTPEVRYWAVKLLARHHGASGVALEVAALAGDPDAGVRAAVAQTLGVLGGPAAVSASIPLLDDPVPFVRAHAARALGNQRLPHLAPLLTRLLDDEDWWVRSGAKTALTALGPAAASHVYAVLESPDRFARNCAAEVLQDTGVLDRLVSAWADDPADEERDQLVQLALRAGGKSFAAAAFARVGFPAIRTVDSGADA